MTKKIRKTYQSIRYPYYYTNVVVDGKIIRISFESASRRGAHYINGKYSTSDPKIQKELEKSPSLNIEYRILEERVLEDDNPEGNNPTINPADLEDINPANPNDPSLKIVEEITMVQDARDWLIKNIKEVTHRQVRNRAQILQVAKEHKVKFPNLK